MGTSPNVILKKSNLLGGFLLPFSPDPSYPSDVISSNSRGANQRQSPAPLQGSPQNISLRRRTARTSHSPGLPADLRLKNIWDFTRKLDFYRGFTRNLPARIGFLQAKTLGFSQFSQTASWGFISETPTESHADAKNASKIHVGGFLRFGSKDWLPIM